MRSSGLLAATLALGVSAAAFAAKVPATTERIVTAEEMGRQGLRIVSWLAGTAIAVPMLAGYFALGATLLVGQSLLDVVRRTRSWLPSPGRGEREQKPPVPKAA